MKNQLELFHEHTGSHYMQLLIDMFLCAMELVADILLGLQFSRYGVCRMVTYAILFLEFFSWPGYFIPFPLEKWKRYRKINIVDTIEHFPILRLSFGSALARPCSSQLTYSSCLTWTELWGEHCVNINCQLLICFSVLIYYCYSPAIWTCVRARFMIYNLWY